jgi:hypothetical protein
LNIFKEALTLRTTDSLMKVVAVFGGGYLLCCCRLRQETRLQRWTYQIKQDFS